MLVAVVIVVAVAVVVVVVVVAEVAEVVVVVAVAVAEVDVVVVVAVVVVGNASWVQSSCVIKFFTRSMKAGSFASLKESVVMATSSLEAIRSKGGRMIWSASILLSLPLTWTVIIIVPFFFIDSAVPNAAFSCEVSLGNPSVISRTACGVEGLLLSWNSVLTTVNALFQLVARSLSFGPVAKKKETPEPKKKNNIRV